MAISHFTGLESGQVKTLLNSLVDDVNDEVTGVNSSITTVTSFRQIQTFDWVNTGARTPQTGMKAGDLGYQQNNDTRWTYTGSAWILFHGVKTFTPDLLASMNLGTGGTRTGLVQVDHRVVRAEMRYVFGTSTVALGTTVAAPFGTLPTSTRQYGTAGQMTIYDASGTTRYTSVVEVDASDVLAPRGSSAASTYVSSASLGGVLTPASGDVLVLQLNYISSTDITTF